MRRNMVLLPRSLSWAALSAAITLALAGAPGALAQDGTEWDETRRRPPVDRPSEYRTHTVDTWLSLAPVVGGFLPDGGHSLEPSPMWGLRFAIEPAEVLEISFEVTTSVPFSEFNEHGGSEIHRFTFDDGQGNVFDIDRQHIEGKIARLSVGGGLINPELMTEGKGFRLVPAINAGLFYFWDYEGEVDLDNATPGGLDATVDVAAFDGEDQAMLFFVAPQLRFEFMPSESFHFGLDMRVTFPIYSTETIGHIEAEEFILGERVIWEPYLFFAIRF